MVAEQTDDGYQEHLSEELRFLENQLERARRKEAVWTKRRAMLEESLRRQKQEMGIEP